MLDGLEAHFLEVEWYELWHEAQKDAVEEWLWECSNLCASELHCTRPRVKWVLNLYTLSRSQNPNWKPLKKSPLPRATGTHTNMHVSKQGVKEFSFMLISYLLQCQNHLCRHLCPTAAVLGSERGRKGTRMTFQTIKHNSDCLFPVKKKIKSCTT
jgi:hypothetical protein